MSTQDNKEAKLEQMKSLQDKATELFLGKESIHGTSHDLDGVVIYHSEPLSKELITQIMYELMKDGVTVTLSQIPMAVLD